jgi:transposase
MTSLPKLSQMSSEQNDALILALFERVQELQMRVDMNSRNSSKPPSSDGYSKPAPKSQRPQGQRSSGGQKGHPTHTLRQSLRVDKVITHAPPSHCSACRSRLQAGCVIDKRQVFEAANLRMQIIEHPLLLSTCACGQTHSGHWPGGINAPVQYGPRAKALVVHLNQHHLVPTARTSALMQDSFGLAINQASVIGCAAQAGGGHAQPHGRQHRRGATKRPRGARR